MCGSCTGSQPDDLLAQRTENRDLQRPSQSSRSLARNAPPVPSRKRHSSSRERDHVMGVNRTGPVWQTSYSANFSPGIQISARRGSLPLLVAVIHYLRDSTHLRNSTRRRKLKKRYQNSQLKLRTSTSEDSPFLIINCFNLRSSGFLRIGD
jgi:hypothetical protein